MDFAYVVKLADESGMVMFVTLSPDNMYDKIYKHLLGYMKTVLLSKEKDVSLGSFEDYCYYPDGDFENKIYLQVVKSSIK